MPESFVLYPSGDTIKRWEKNINEAYATINTLRAELDGHKFEREGWEFEVEKMRWEKRCVRLAPLWPRLWYFLTGNPNNLIP